MENFVLNENGQIDINRKGIESTYKFHLQEINHNAKICSSSKDMCDDTATSISSYSVYKQRIDAMFDDSRSILSDMSRLEKKRRSLLMNKDSQMASCKERIISNNIQEKIEKMFEEISVNGLQRYNSGRNRSSQRSLLSSNESTLKHDFNVVYLGSKPLQDKNVSLTSLQDPLKELYFVYKKKPPEDLVHVLTISKEGLKINISGKEELNQFSAIAVWASVKLSFRQAQNKTEYAFLPLVTEPDGMDKNLLYKELKKEDRFAQNDDEQSPIFAVVMKNFNMNKQLECHGFVCKSSEEAIIIAANLYQALMKKLKRKKDVREQKLKKVNEDVVVEVTEPVESPIFTVIMKNNKSHSLVCASSKDAIVIAANLFQALMKKLQIRKDVRKQKDFTESAETPIFTVVMKTSEKQLQSHGFVCKSSEEAITEAENLYQDLIKKLKRKTDLKEQKLKNDDEEVKTEESIFTVVIKHFEMAKQLECHGFVCRAEESTTAATDLYQGLVKKVNRKKDFRVENIVEGDKVDIEIKESAESTILTVVMKNVDMSKQLECDGFDCKSSEVAANLYQALVQKLNRKKDFREQELNEIDKEIVIEVMEPAEEISAKPKVKVKKPAPPIPEKKLPIKLKEEELSRVFSAEKKNLSSEEKDIIHLDHFEGRNESSSKLSQRRGSVPVNIHCKTSESARTLRRTVSDRGSNGLILKETPGEGGDILTKVAIPRSRSFLNANGPLTRYSGRHKTNSENEILSPLGFKELFNEFRLHEGLESMDDILNAIIDAEGMSFNDLKPIYKEFLLKLAVTLTKDELYQRSKIIMRRQKKKNKKCNFRKRAFFTSIGIHKFFRKTASKLGKSKASKSKPTNLEFTSVVFQSTSKQFESNPSNFSKTQMKSCRVKKRPSSRRRLAKRIERVKSKHVSTTSEDSDFFQPKRNTNDSGGGPNRASSGYFSCSECSCDSNNCICTRTDKCYCTLGKNKGYNASSSDESRIISNNRSSFRVLPQQTDQSDSLITCSCDSDSCVRTPKCYCNQNTNKRPPNKVYHLSEVKRICQTPHLHQKEKLHNTDCPVYIKSGCRKHGDTIFDQLRQQGFAASESTLSRAASPTTAWLTNEKRLNQKKCFKSSGSLEYLKMQKSDGQGYNFDDHLLREIQNTTYRRDLSLSDYLDSDLSLRKHNLPLTPSFPCGRRLYSSMRCRNECVNSYNPEILKRSMSYRTKNFFNSVRSRHSCDSIMNHIKFPNANDANSSLRFTRRMDVYNSLSEGKRYNQYEDFIAYKENRRKANFDHEVFSEDSDRFHFSGGNLKRLDYNLFKNSKPALDKRMNRKKVLVVSARDPKGKVLYMGTSNRSDISIKNKKNLIDSPATNASEALAVKKSAEIAALFSDVTLKQKIIHPDYAKDHKLSNHRPRSNSYRTTNLENTLGYLP